MSTTQTDKPSPVKISPEATFALNQKIREWTGWRKGKLLLGPTNAPESRWAICERANKTIKADPTELILNPNRVLLTVTPFRLRQEAVLTGALLHECGHARYTRWLPEYVDQMSSLTHSDGTAPTAQTIALAKLMEEPRVETRIAEQAKQVGVTDLVWTMRAMAAHLLPMTKVSADPAQQIMDLINSWALRAGRQVGLAHVIQGYRTPGWVNQFTSLVKNAIEAHLQDRIDRGADLNPEVTEDDFDTQGDDPLMRSLQILGALTSMIHCTDDSGPFMIDTARQVLEWLFPETSEDDDTDEDDSQAMPGGACSAGMAQPQPSEEQGEAGEGDEPGSEQGEGNSDPEDEGSGDEPGAGDSGDDEDADPEQGGDSQDSDQDSEGADESDEQDSREGQDPEGSDEPGEDGSEDDSEDDSEESGASASTDLQRALAAMEAQAGDHTTAEAETKAGEAPSSEDSGTGASAGSGGRHGGGWRTPAPAEREVQKGAEHFLRDLIDASESSKNTLTDQPSAQVDGAALSAWKAGGQVREPHFFVRTNRSVEPSPPIEIAILVDVSASMDELQRPSALLSWSLAAAALDLRNFAGRGQQIRSTLIHWGDSVRVMQRPGEMIPGIREAACNQGTSNMHGALEEVERQMPGFFDHRERPVNRLLVQFTDWKIWHPQEVVPWLSRGLESGVNMLSVVPNNFSHRWSEVNKVFSQCRIQRGGHSVIKYNPSQPGFVWTQAAEVLASGSTGVAPAPFPGF